MVLVRPEWKQHHWNPLASALPLLHLLPALDVSSDAPSLQFHSDLDAFQTVCASSVAANLLLPHRLLPVTLPFSSSWRQESPACLLEVRWGLSLTFSVLLSSFVRWTQSLCVQKSTLIFPHLIFGRGEERRGGKIALTNDRPQYLAGKDDEDENQEQELRIILNGFPFVVGPVSKWWRPPRRP